MLDFTRSLDTSTDAFRGFPQPVSAELFVIHAWDFDVDVDPVEQGTGDSFLVFRDHGLRTRTRLLGIPIKAAGTWVYTIGQLFSRQVF